MAKEIFNLAQNIDDPVIRVEDICRRISQLEFLVTNNQNSADALRWQSEHLRLKSALCRMHGHGPFEWNGNFYPEILTAVPEPVPTTRRHVQDFNLSMFSMGEDPRPFHFIFRSDSGKAWTVAMHEAKKALENARDSINDETWALLADDVDTFECSEEQIAGYYSYYKEQYLNTEEGQKDLDTIRAMEHRIAILEGKL